MELSAMELFQKEAPDVASAFHGLIESLIQSHGLDPKIKQLIYIAMKASQGDTMAVKAHVSMAKALGVTRAEVIDAILLSLTVSGISGVLACLPEVVTVYGEQ